MCNEYKNKLMSIREEHAKIYNTSEDVNVIKQAMLKELDIYANVIPEFFSYNKEAQRIKDLYKKLKTLDYTRNRVILCISVDCAGYSFNEYFNGMTIFINKYIDCALSESDMMTKQLETAIQADPLFIDSLFGGKNNEVQEQELTIAVKNIEYLVDFFEILKNIRKDISDICAKCEQSHIDNNKYINILRLIANSSCLFSNRMICNIFHIYDKINYALDDKYERNDISTFKVF